MKYWWRKLPVFYFQLLYNEEYFQSQQSPNLTSQSCPGKKYETVEQKGKRGEAEWVSSEMGCPGINPEPQMQQREGGGEMIVEERE